MKKYLFIGLGIVAITIGSFTVSSVWSRFKESKQEPTNIHVQVGDLPVASSTDELPVVSNQTEPIKVIVNIESDPAMAYDVLTMVNNYRNSVGLADLTINTKLQAAAEAKADDMIVKGYFSHARPDFPYKNYSDFIKETGYEFDYYMGENLARFWTDADGGVIVMGWLQSPTHKANMTHTKYTETGVAVRRNVPCINKDLNVSALCILVVQEFGAPKSN